MNGLVIWRQSSTIWSSVIDAATAALPAADVRASVFQLTLDSRLQLQSIVAAIRRGISFFIVVSYLICSSVTNSKGTTFFVYS